MDESNDTGNIDDKMFLVLWCGFTQTRTTFVILDLSLWTGKGFLMTLRVSLRRLGIRAIDGELCIMLISIGTDGASANIAIYSWV